MTPCFCSTCRDADRRQNRKPAEGKDDAEEQKPAEGKDDAEEQKPAEAKAPAEEQKQKQADIMIRQAKREAALFHSSDGETWADIRIGGHRETWAIRSRGFRRWLILLFRKVKALTTPGRDAVSQAIETLDAMATIEGDEREVHVRVAEHSGIIYLDLCDKQWRAIEISAGGGWRIVNEPPVRFRRSPAMLPLPEPEKGGDINLLRKYLNVQNHDDFVLTASWLLAALRPRGPYPVLALNGEHGSAKSTFAKITRALVDPNELPIRRPPKEARDLFISAYSQHVISLDNLSELPPWLSDALCTMSTEGAFGTRKLFTDSDEQLFKAKRPVIVNGIVSVITKPDLTDRALFLTLDVIAEEHRRDEAEFWTAFRADQAKILGVLLDAVAYGLKALPGVRPPRLPRMADFAKWGMACEGAFWEEGTFEKAYRANRIFSVEETLASDQVAMAVRTLMDGRTEWNGLTKELLVALNEIVGERISKARDWPQSERKLTEHLKIAVTFLRRVGIRIAWSEKRTKFGRPVSITATLMNNPETPSAPSLAPKNSESESNSNKIGGDGLIHPNRHNPLRPSMQSSPANPLKTRAGDGGDGGDGISGNGRDGNRPQNGHLCDHCGLPGRTRGWDWPGRPDGIRLHERCEGPWLDSEGR